MKNYWLEKRKDKTDHIYGFKTPTKHMIMATSMIPLIEILTLDPKTLPRKGIFRETVLQNQRQQLSEG
jgi:hypothetical protein